MKRLRWLVLAASVPPGGGLGGMVRYTTEMIAALRRRDDIEVFALANGPALDTVAEMVGDSEHVRALPAVLSGPAVALGERAHPYAVHGFDVVHGTKHIVPRRTTALRVLTVHDMLPLDRPADFPLVKRMFLPGPYRRSIAQADVLACVSNATRERLVAHQPAAAARAIVVPLATSDRLRDAEPAAVSALRTARFALVVGDASPRKNLAIVVRAWELVREQVPDALLAIAGPPDWSGSGPDAARSALIESGGAVALGHVSDAQLRWCYDRAHVVLCPSRAEGFGLPVAEALSLGAPVIVSTDAAQREVAAGRAIAEIDPDDVRRWAAVIVDAFASGRSPRPALSESIRTWDDAASELVDATRGAIQARRHGSDAGRSASGVT
jgi:glycosyltransferase involved in cell wall biosynthesis